MNMSSAEFMKLTIQEVADMLISEGKKNALCKGMVDDEPYLLKVELINNDKN